MIITLKQCRNLRVLDFITERLLPVQELVNIIEKAPKENKQYLASIGLAYAIVTDCELATLKYLISVSEIKDSLWYFEPKEFGGIGKQKKLIEYAILYCSSLANLKLLIKETNSLKYLQWVITHTPEPILSLARTKQILQTFDLNVNIPFSIDDTTFNICEPNLLLHYFLDKPELVDFLIIECGASIEAVNAIGFDFITYCIVKNKYNIAIRQIKGNSQDLEQLVLACKYLSRWPKNVVNQTDPDPWSVFLGIQKIILQYYGSTYHPILPYILQRLQKLTDTLDLYLSKSIRASLIKPLVQYLKKSRSINYKAIKLVKQVVQNNIEDNEYVLYNDLIELLEVMKRFNLTNVEKLKYLIQNNTHPTCGN